MKVEVAQEKISEGMLEGKQGTLEVTSFKQLAPDWTEKKTFVLFYPIS